MACRALREFWERHKRAEQPLKAWYADVSSAAWHGPADVKTQFDAAVDFIADSRVIFDIAGNKYRLVVHVAYRFGRVLIKLVGTHKEYDRIGATAVQRMAGGG